MMEDVAWGILFPLLGTTLGSGCVFFMVGKMNRSVQRGLMGFAAGVMVAASIWSLIIPSIEMSDNLGIWAFVPAVIGFAVGVAFLLFLDHHIPHLHMNASKAEGPDRHLARTTMLIFAVTLHNIPEGMAVGAAYAGFLYNPAEVSLAAASALSLGIGIQNFPEGAIISMPLKAAGLGKWKAFFGGTLSGLVEPVAAILMILVTGWMLPILPYALSFAAGAMMFVVVEELIPEMSAGEHSDIGVLTFSLGFLVMMSLDVALG